MINPLIDCVEREVSFLQTGHLSWRHGIRKCQYIRSIQEYVESTQWPNLQDFSIENGGFAKFFELHDRHLAELEVCAGKSFDSLLSNTMFGGLVQHHLRQFESMTHAKLSRDPLDSTDLDIIIFCAENVINNLNEVPSHYVYATFWNASGKNLMPWKSDLLDALNAKAKEFSDSSLILADELKSVRLSLSREHDVPAAPIPGMALPI